MCVSDRHDMTLAVKVALNPNTTNQQTDSRYRYSQSFESGYIFSVELPMS